MGRVCTSLGGGTGAPDRIGIGEFIKGQFYADGKIKLKPVGNKRTGARQASRAGTALPQPPYRH
jgi:hypothetical protein